MPKLNDDIHVGIEVRITTTMGSCVVVRDLPAMTEQRNLPFLQANMGSQMTGSGLNLLVLMETFFSVIGNHEFCPIAARLEAIAKL